ncbi:hypothetical protein L2E82_49121 [Cichorium intybus]|uniref:Uncharacterized protein n=1 Tax=Cichorium intybus TaxID=13427 RepID=A0ACB8Z115_CICIN|nr:hypothetical protein L2E82_49121 [Cichorium intybus]
MSSTATLDKESFLKEQNQRQTLPQPSEETFTAKNNFQKPGKLKGSHCFQPTVGEGTDKGVSSESKTSDNTPMTKSDVVGMQKPKEDIYLGGTTDEGTSKRKQQQTDPFEETQTVDGNIPRETKKMK